MPSLVIVEPDDVAPEAQRTNIMVALNHMEEASPGRLLAVSANHNGICGRGCPRPSSVLLLSPMEVWLVFPPVPMTATMRSVEPWRALPIVRVAEVGEPSRVVASSSMVR